MLDAEQLKAEVEHAADWFAPEELCPDLQACLTKTPDGTPWLRNYLVNQPWYIPALNKQSNLTYKAKLERIAELEKAGEYDKILFYYERPWRLDAFIKYKHQLSDDQYWESLASVWVDAENPNRNRWMWLILFQMPRTNRHLLMDEEERKVLSELPEEFTVYRGCLPRYRLGISWTLDEKRAAWFSVRWNKKGRVYTATAKKKDVFAYFDGRHEEEIIINPKRLKDIKPHETTAKPQRRISSTTE